ncbi:XcyI family restriction endonuclease [Syntrophomonas palmitatica]|uniref:XcyI family restriction endonuclease n=1 Tax=Syntrophomonas palmitatica TaxID=402877 RepID=UPI0006D1FC9A|nr:XcyI family restriction endonuclease [Syntrophomonas palmitatica]
MSINIPPPSLQIDFHLILQQFRNTNLQDALKKTVRHMDISCIDQDMARLVPKNYLALVAGYGLRGELLFSVPCILGKNPFLLGYYRLLLGFSKKAFYTSEFGCTSFIKMEEEGKLSPANEVKLEELCKALINSACFLLDGVNQKVTASELDDLTLLTLGAQLRGSQNTRKGKAGMVAVFQIIREIVDGATINANNKRIQILNAAKRKVLIEFSADPDIIIREEMPNAMYRNIIAIEVKGGEDFSNIHNRIGEAEKSHQKAKLDGYVECWTIVNVDRINMSTARKESPSTNQIFRLSDLVSRSGNEYVDFQSRIKALTGIE